MSVGFTFPVLVKLFATDKNSTISFRCTALSQSGLKALNCRIDDRAALWSSWVITYEEIQTNIVHISVQSFYSNILFVRIGKYSDAEKSTEGNTYKNIADSTQLYVERNLRSMFQG
jgi:hypothetical protein